MTGGEDRVQPKVHWEKVYSSTPLAEVSWFQERAGLSLRLIRESGVPRTAAIVDAGGGASRLVGDLLAGGYDDLTVIDVSGAALRAAKSRLGERAELVRWIEADILDAAALDGHIPEHSCDLWHDRAVFHFLTSPGDRKAYVRRVLAALRPGGFLVIATFAEDGPEKCSGLPVMRYSAEGLLGEVGEGFEPVASERESHTTPGGVVQRFVYCLFRKKTSAPE